ncbi:ATP-binding cassette domain-containing protein [Erysipelothrix sp. HDW6C]|uniref:ATP-binding cassette domain-containing protein n=1 Tax=Erysipelothrix sp. HDW6C TaxID=2714930 RepID=UPI0014091D42|nr:ATP-binding cassette domain-containing protein [Erysipelothrix sp. HDW6C]QIK70476.1 ATP-binding cassette domain-containing protein [Erysipelothrix sp. HDW6C]
MIEVTNITKKYGSFFALDDITLDIASNKVTAIVGENGSGKSTLLNIMGRLNNATSGSVLLDSKDINTYASLEYACKIATLKQANTINLRLRVIDLVGFGRYPHNQGRLNADDILIVEESLAFMQCLDLRDKFIDQLSGGQLQRVYIAMILAQDTDVMLLDEPLNNLDLKHAHELMELIRQLVDEHGKTVVIIMHDLNMVYRYVDNIIALKHGRLICDGAVDDVLNEHMLHEIYDMHFEIQKCETHTVAFIK